jgi:hypothetical protein
VVAAAAGKTSGSHTATGNWQDITSWTANFDTHGTFNSTTGEYTVSVPGVYRTSLVIEFAANSSGQRSGAIALNGTRRVISGGVNGGATYGTSRTTTINLNCVAGDIIKPQAFQDSGGNLNYGVSTGQNVFTVERLSGPSQIAASETVAARYADTSGQAIGTSLGIFKFATKDYDSHGAMNTSSGVYTAPTSGKYSIDVTIFTNAILLSATQALVLAVYKNGTLFSYLGQSNGNGAGVNQFIQGYDTISLNAGDTLSVYISSSVAGAGNTTAGTNHVEINRIGN